MRPDSHGTVLTQDEFMEDQGDDEGSKAWDLAPTVFDPDSVPSINIDPISGEQLSLTTACAKVNYWRRHRINLKTQNEDIEPEKAAVGYSIDTDVPTVGKGINSDVPDVPFEDTNQVDVNWPWMECWDQTHQASYYYNQVCLFYV